MTEIEMVIKMTVPNHATNSDVERVIENVRDHAANRITGVTSVEVRNMRALKLDDLLFLWNEVHRAGRDMRRIDPGEVFGGMTCNEAQSLADVFAAAGDQETHDFIIDSHSRSDDDPEDDHHDLYLKHREERHG